MNTDSLQENIGHSRLINSDFLEITDNRKEGILLARWLRNVQSREYRSGIEQIEHILLKQGIDKLLVNNQRMGVLTMDDQGWLAEISIKVFSSISLKKLAVVSSTDCMQQYTNEILDKRVKEATPYFSTEYFLSEREGLEWLVSA